MDVLLSSDNQLMPPDKTVCNPVVTCGQTAGGTIQRLVLIVLKQLISCVQLHAERHLLAVDKQVVVC